MQDKNFFLGIFKSGHDLVAATRKFNEGGFTIADAYTPFAVHGLEKAMGLKHSKMTHVAFAWGAFGLSLGLLAQYWLSAIDWPINIGGRPFNSMPAFMPISFEVMILFAGVGTVLTFFVRSGLFPGKSPKLTWPGITNDRFVLAISRDVGGFDDDLAQSICDAHNGESVTRWTER
jgi:hypothetical protein